MLISDGWLSALVVAGGVFILFAIISILANEGGALAVSVIALAFIAFLWAANAPFKPIKGRVVEVKQGLVLVDVAGYPIAAEPVTKIKLEKSDEVTLEPKDGKYIVTSYIREGELK